MRVLIADKMPDAARTRLQEARLEVLVDPSLDGETLTAALREHDPDVLVVRSTKVRSEHFAAARSLELVVRAGAGTNTIDIDSAGAKGVFVANCPGMNAVAVAELTWAHFLNADRRVADNVAELRAGRWGKKRLGAGARGIKGRTLGVIGLGAIGREVVRRAHAFEAEVVAFDPNLDDAQAAALGVRRAESAVDVARVADLLTVHVALTPATRGLIGPAVFEALRPGAIFVNTSRGEVVDERALAVAVQERGLRAGLDVFCGEPPADGEWASELAGLDGVYGTHHIAASTEQAQLAVADETLRVILEYARTGEAPNCVNIAQQTPATHLMVVRHADSVGVLAGILDRLREANLNVQQMENVILSGDDGAACARIQLEGEPPAGLRDELTTDDGIYSVKVVSLN